MCCKGSATKYYEKDLIKMQTFQSLRFIFLSIRGSTKCYCFLKTRVTVLLHVSPNIFEIFNLI